MKSARNAKLKSAEGVTEAKKSVGFTDEERAAMRERVEEMKAEARPLAYGKGGRGERRAREVRRATQPDRTMAERIHAIIKGNAPVLSAKTWYGMPAYAKDGNVVCFFQRAQKFKTRYATLGFTGKANLDEGRMWPTAFALKELTAAEEARLRRW